MHPIFASRMRLTLYLVAWVLVGLMLVILLQITAPRPLALAMLQGLPMALIYAFMSLSAWWVCRAAPLGSSSPLRTLAIVVGDALVASFLWAVIGGVWERVALALALRLDPALLTGLPSFGGLLAAQAAPETLRLRDFTLFVTAGVPLYLFSAAVHYLIIAFESSRAAELRVYEAQVVARDAELRALRAQLNPHFLFNSLNSINALVGIDPEGARRMCEGLGDFLRRTLALAAQQTVPLRDEISLVERYLAIEQVRFGDRLTSRVHMSADAARCQVPPLLLQPLVENAVKHGVSERLEGGQIQIAAERLGDQLQVTVENPYDDEPTTRPGHGVGLENVRRRLQVVDSRRAGLSATRENGVFRVVLNLQAVEAPSGEIT